MLELKTKHLTQFGGLVSIALLASCASQPPSHTTEIIKHGEQLIDFHPAENSTKHQRIDASKEHLLEIYNGQQKIVERMEARQRQREARRHQENGDEFSEIAEEHAAPLPEDISSDELLRILEKQQSLIEALRAPPHN